MDLKEIRQLIKIVENSNIGELEILEEGKKLRISKSSKNFSETVVVGSNPAPVYAPPMAQTAPAAVSVPAVDEPMEVASNSQEVRSPMVGTFYSAPSPESEPYVGVGQNIQTGQTLCIIEAMKLMNEIQSEYSGKISKIMVENGQPVEYNQVLFLIEK